MAFLQGLSQVKLKPTKTKTKNVDGSTSVASPYKTQNATIHECKPDIHLPRKQYVSMTTEHDSQSDESKQDPKDHESAPPQLLITHISDTHLKHHRLNIPYGDILIHSGDFVKSCYWPKGVDGSKVEQHVTANNITARKELEKWIPAEILEFNAWLGTLPHKYKVCIAGNHECVFNELSAAFIQKYLLTNCIYLQDSGCSLYGIKIYGSPWTTCGKRMSFSFGGDWNFLYSRWQAIPSDTDVVVTHLPPLGIFDCAWGSKYSNKEKCKICGEVHEKYAHWGCAQLLREVRERIKPKVHLFGHVHDDVGFQYDEKHGVLFVNSAMDIFSKAHRIKVIFDQ